MNPNDLFIDEQLTQIVGVLQTKDDAELRANLDVRSLLICYGATLRRLRAAERFCVAAKALAEYKKPLNQVLDALDAWERIATTETAPCPTPEP